MIKAEDLRIGDLVRICNDCLFPEGTVCRVIQVYPEKTYIKKEGVVTLSYIDGTDDGPWGVWCNSIEGIPLTPTLLGKNGFNIKDSEDFSKSYIKDIDKKSKHLGRYFDIEYKNGVWLVFLRVKLLPDPVLVREIQYVHELQHIFWAMGIDAVFEM